MIRLWLGCSKLDNLFSKDSWPEIKGCKKTGFKTDDTLFPLNASKMLKQKKIVFSKWMVGWVGGSKTWFKELLGTIQNVKSLKNDIECLD
jgi:hypothetical protein